MDRPSRVAFPGFNPFGQVRVQSIPYLIIVKACLYPLNRLQSERGEIALDCEVHYSP
jgi:hypothetical protein